MNVKIGTEAAHFPLWGYFFRFLVLVLIHSTYKDTPTLNIPLLEPEIYVRAVCMTGVYELYILDMDEKHNYFLPSPPFLVCLFL
jgi:hypothetical protein